jgi:hypothetical protein
LFPLERTFKETIWVMPKRYWRPSGISSVYYIWIFFRGEPMVLLCPGWQPTQGQQELLWAGEVPEFNPGLLHFIELPHLLMYISSLLGNSYRALETLWKTPNNLREHLRPFYGVLPNVLVYEDER